MRQAHTPDLGRRPFWGFPSRMSDMLRRWGWNFAWKNRPRRRASLVYHMESPESARGRTNHCRTKYSRGNLRDCVPVWCASIAGKRSFFFLWPWTSSYDSDLRTWSGECQGERACQISDQRSFSAKVIVRTHTYRAYCSTYTTIVMGNSRKLTIFGVIVVLMRRF